MFLGSKKPEGKTVLLLDVENGSVAAALARLEPEREPRIFGAMRKALPISHSVSSSALALGISHAAREVLQHASTVAARVRGNDKLAHVGEISKADIFLSAPWTTFEDGWSHEEELSAGLSGAVEEYFGDTGIHTHPFGKALASTTHALFPSNETLLFSTVTGEVTELLLLRGGVVVGRATIPGGRHLILRTLKSHGGLSFAEARSALHLQPAHAAESLSSAAAHFVREFKDAARELLLNASVRSVYVVVEEPLGEWFAQALGGESLEELFPEGGVVRALRTHHLRPYVTSPAQADLFLMLETLYVDANSFV